MSEPQDYLNGRNWTTPRCARCGWPLAARMEDGCVPGNCSFRTDDPNWKPLNERTPDPRDARIAELEAALGHIANEAEWKAKLAYAMWDAEHTSKLDSDPEANKQFMELAEKVWHFFSPFVCSQLTAREAELKQAREAEREAVAALTCNITRNTCGTDTWRRGWACKCTPCQVWLRARATLDKMETRD